MIHSPAYTSIGQNILRIVSGTFFYKLLDERSLLERLLNSQSPAEAWAEFLRRYSNLFFKVIWQHERNHDDAVEKYLFVCTKFAENDFAKLRKFQTDYGTRPAKLSTWLAAVTRNLCIDAHRAAHGRRRFPAALLRMTDFERNVFRLYYWEGCTDDEVINKLDATAEKLSEALDQIQSALGEKPAQKHPEFIPLDDNVHINEPGCDNLVRQFDRLKRFICRKIFADFFDSPVNDEHIERFIFSRN
ncbi:MAG: hypothetical protein AAB209_06480, partial [Bacteroidota bacterium]